MRAARECLAIDAAGSIRASQVIEALSRLVSERGALRALRSSTHSPALAERTTESFNGKLRDECLSLEWFRNRRHYAGSHPEHSLDCASHVQHFPVAAAGADD